MRWRAAVPDAAPQHDVTYRSKPGLEEIVAPLLRRGLRHELLHELPRAILELRLPALESDEKGMRRGAGHQGSFPRSFSRMMTKEGLPRRTPGARGAATSAASRATRERCLGPARP